MYNLTFLALTYSKSVLPVIYNFYDHTLSSFLSRFIKWMCYFTYSENARPQVTFCSYYAFYMSQIFYKEKKSWWYKNQQLSKTREPLKGT